MNYNFYIPILPFKRKLYACNYAFDKEIFNHMMFSWNLERCFHKHQDYRSSSACDQGRPKVGGRKLGA